MKRIAEFWFRVQGNLFPHLRECLGTLSEGQDRVALVLEFVRIENHVEPYYLQKLGRKLKDRKTLARADADRPTIHAGAVERLGLR